VLFQLAYLLFTAPRVDSSAFEAVRSNARNQLRDRGADPSAAFSDTLSATLMQHHLWSRPLTLVRADSVTVGPVYSVYRDRFADASDFTFVLVGTFNLDSLRPLVRRYLGALPVKKREDSPRDPGITTPAGVVDRVVKQGIAPQSRTALVYSGSMEWKPAERWVLKGIAEILEVRLREKLREDLGGTYSVSVSSDRIRIPRPEYRISIRYGSAPDRAADLASAVAETVDSLRRFGPTDTEVANWKANELRQHEVALRENDYWISLLASVDAQGEQIATLLEIKPWLDQTSAEKLRAGAERYLNPGRYVRVTLLPAETAAP
jgi:zinc protease